MNSMGNQFLLIGRPSIKNYIHWLNVCHWGAPFPLMRIIKVSELSVDFKMFSYTRTHPLFTYLIQKYT